MKIFIIILVSVFWEVSAVHDEYCEIDCQGRFHIGCGNTGDYSSSCDEHAKVLQLNSHNRGKIVNLHNELRNRIASGNLQPYQSAAKMGSVTWDDELAILAELHVKQCDPIKSGLCCNTKNFKYAGQNLHFLTGDNVLSPEEVIETAINGWYEEYMNADMSVIDNFMENNDGKENEHFTVMVNEKNSRVGCAMLQGPKGNMLEYYSVCNYASANIHGEQIYEKGTPTSGCKSGTHPVYTFLCDIFEKYDV